MSWPPIPSRTDRLVMIPPTARTVLHASVGPSGIELPRFASSGAHGQAPCDPRRCLARTHGVSRPCPAACAARTPKSFRAEYGLSPVVGSLVPAGSLTSDESRADHQALARSAQSGTPATRSRAESGRRTMRADLWNRLRPVRGVDSTVHTSRSRPAPGDPADGCVISGWTDVPRETTSRPRRKARAATHARCAAALCRRCQSAGWISM